MVRYYFDTFDGETTVNDEEGLEFPDLAAAKTAAGQALGEMARDAHLDSEPRELFVEVRHGDQVLFRSTLKFGVQTP